MSTVRESFRDEMRRDPEQLESEADRAREHLEHTLEALERRLSPGELLDTVLRSVRSNGSEFGHNLATQARNNPIPLLLTGAGLAWLITASNRPPVPAEGPGVGERAAGAASAARHAAGSAQGMASSTAASVRQSADRAAATGRSMAASARERAQGARDTASHAAQWTADAGRQVSSATRSGARSLYEGYDHLRHEQPLVLGALAVAAGAIIGSMLPSSRAEDRTFGEYRDRALDELGSEARRQAQRVGDVAAETAESAAEAARDSMRSNTGARTGDRSGVGTDASSTTGGTAAPGAGSNPVGSGGISRGASSPRGDSRDPNPGLP